METTWREQIMIRMRECGELLDDIESSTLSEQQLDDEFNNGYGGSEGIAFTVWTKHRVYFPAVYDGAEWVESVSRNPDGVPTSHIGGE
jgi:hypothetical protein